MPDEDQSIAAADPLDDASLDEDAGIDGDALSWPDLATRDYNCDEILAEDDPEPCEPGQLLGPDGRCGETWVCPEGWLRVGDYGCRPPPLPDCAEGSYPLPDGTCLEPWPCPEPWVPVDDGLPGCKPPPFAECPAGSMALTDGTCSPVWECPAGWHRPEGARGCAPPEICTTGVPTADGTCSPLDFPECPDDRWGLLAGMPGAIYVDPGAEGHGDGTLERPLNDLEQALDVGAGRTIVLAAGIYRPQVDGQFWVAAHTRLIGVCHKAVRIEGPVRLAGPRASLNMVTVRPTSVEAGRAGVGIIADAREVSLSRVAVSGGWRGVNVNPGAQLHLADVSMSGQRNVGLAVFGAVYASRLRIDEGGEYGVYFNGEEESRLSESFVASSEDEAIGLGGFGVLIYGGGARLADVQTSGWQQALGVQRKAWLDGARLAVHRGSWRANTFGLAVQQGGRASLHDIYVGGEFSWLGRLHGDVHVARLLLGDRRQGALTKGAGLVVSGRASLTDIEVFSVPNRGVLIHPPTGGPEETLVSGTRWIVRDVAEHLEADGQLWVGIGLTDGVRVQLEDARVERVPHAGIAMDTDGSGDAPRLHLSRVHITGIETEQPEVSTVGLASLAARALVGHDLRIDSFGDIGALVSATDDCRLAQIAVGPPVSVRPGGTPIGAWITNQARCDLVRGSFVDTRIGVKVGGSIGPHDAPPSGHLSGEEIAMRFRGPGASLQGWHESTAVVTKLSTTDMGVEVGRMARLAVSELASRMGADGEAALYVTETGQLSVDRAWIQALSTNVALVDARAELEISRATLLGGVGTQPILAKGEGRLAMRDTWLDDVHRSAITAIEHSRVHLTRIGIRDAPAFGPALRGRAQVRALGFAEVDASDLWLTNSGVIGIYAREDSRVRGERVTLADPLPAVTPDVLRGGVIAAGEAVASLDRLDVGAMPGRGVAAIQGGHASLSRLRITDWEEPLPSGYQVGGLVAESGGSIRAYGLYTSGGAGAVAIAAEASISLHGARMAPVAVQDIPEGHGYGVTSTSGTVELRSVRLEGRHDAIIHADGGTVHARCLRVSGGSGPAIQAIGTDTEVEVEDFYAGQVDRMCVLADGVEARVLLTDGTLEMCSTCTAEGRSGVVWSAGDVAQRECE